MRTLTGQPGIPNTVTYVFGNPLIARFILQEDLAASTFIPPRLVIKEIFDAASDVSKTAITYHLPSSLIPETSNQTLREQLITLDRKVEKLVLYVMRETSLL